jgi:hypothetical protein
MNRFETRVTGHTLREINQAATKVVTAFFGTGQTYDLDISPMTEITGYGDDHPTYIYSATVTVNS